jgi:hypothetical protein
MAILAVAVAAEQPPQAIGSLFCVLGFEPNGRWFFWKSRRVCQLSFASIICV